MKARIYKVPTISSMWFWDIRNKYSVIGDCAFTRKGAERAARRAWKKENQSNIEYEIDL
jgi:hypothetical protein